MTRVIVVADSGSVMSDLTAAIGSVPGWYIVRHGSGRAPLDRLVAHMEPDLVVIGDLAVPAEAIARLTEVRRAAPAAKVVILSSTPDADWLVDALRAEVSALLPANVAPHTLAIVLREVMASTQMRKATASESDPARERRLRAAARRRRRRAQRIPRIELPHEGTAA
jgi:DNA-binding NarL/FixJ family response regulator